MSALIVIPARMASTRFPNKPMAKIAGKTMIERVWRVAKASTLAGGVIIATDDELLADFARGFGAEVLMTSQNCLTGTDRVAEAMGHFPEQTIFFSLQGDAVLTPPWVIDEVLLAMIEDPSIGMATPAVKLEGEALKGFVDSKRGGSSSGTCVVFDRCKNALYFSKALIPYNRTGDVIIYRHIGLYAYRREVLARLSLLPESPLEKMEKLEQLRALENGIPIRIVEVDYRGRTHGSVDRPEDVAIVESLIAKEGELMARLLLMRHGNTFEEGQTAVQVGRRTDLPLTDFGRQQAKKVAGLLKASPPQAIFAGGLKRQTESAAIIAGELGMTFEEIPALNEIDYGLWEGLSPTEIAENWPKEHAEWSIESKWQGHIFRGSYERHLELLQAWLKTLNVFETVFAVTSGGVLRFFKNEKVKTGHLCELELLPNQIKLGFWNLDYLNGFPFLLPNGCCPC